MRSTDSVAAHIFEYAYLTADAGFVGDASERAEVMVVADSLELYAFSVEEEAFAVDDFGGADTEDSGIFVF